MANWLGREIGLLRRIAAHLEERPLPVGGLTQAYMRSERLGHVRQKADRIVAIRMPEHIAFTDLATCLLDRFPMMERGAPYTDIQDQLFTFVENLVGQEPSSVGARNAEDLIAHFESWLADKIASRRVFVPCVISQIPAPRFEIGPVAFEFIDHVPLSDFYPRGDQFVAASDRKGFDDLMQWMRDGDADWLARVSVEGCDQARAQEIAEITVDLAIVAVQLAAPNLDTRRMARLDARRGASQKRTLSESGGCYTVGWARKDPGPSINERTLPRILQRSAPIFTAIGNMVRSFASGSFRLQTIEQGWCDAAYWFHQALSETIDTIAIAQLETALEALLVPSSSNKSKQRIIAVLNAFFGLQRDDPVTEGSPVTAAQLAGNIVHDRSRVLHGSWSTLNKRVTNRAGLEGFVADVLRIAAIEIETYACSTSPADEVEELLNWIRQRVSSADGHTQMPAQSF